NLYKDGLQRARFLPAIALIEQHCHVVEMVSAHDWRLRALTQAPVYLTPPGAESHRALERIFASQASGAIELDGMLRINGRGIPFHKRADYIALAKAGPAVIVANVPQFTIYSEDAAKRFVQLVDEFYDRRVKLVLSA